MCGCGGEIVRRVELNNQFEEDLATFATGLRLDVAKPNEAARVYLYLGRYEDVITILEQYPELKGIRCLVVG